MSNRSYLLRLMIPFAVMIAAVVALSGWLIYNSGLESARRQQVDSLARDARVIAQTIRGDNAKIYDAVLERVASEAHVRNVRVSLINGTGAVIFDTHADLNELNNHNDRPEIIDARRNGVGTSIRMSRSQREQYIYAAERVSGVDGLVVRTSRPEQSPITVSRAMIGELALAVGLSITIMWWLAMTLHRRWIAPVRRLASAANELAQGRWDVRVVPEGNAELRAFSTQLNYVAEQAQKQLADLRQQRSDLSALVDSLPDPIVLTDAQQRVILINEPAARFLSVTTLQAMGQKLISILGESSLVELYEHLLQNAGEKRPNQPYMREIRVTRKGQKLTYQAVAARTGAGGMLVVLRDVTKLASAVQMKTDFVANASHELRTPIAAIKIAFETLSDVYTDDEQQTSRCIDIIAGHLQRLENMLQDLLDLSRVESTELKPQLTDVRSGDLLAHVRNAMGTIARNKGVELHVENDEDIVFVSDRKLLDLSIKNLVENSIKYTPEGGRVSVRIWRELSQQDDGRSHVLIRITDTGIGIPPQHLERVFERFYQVDSARSGSSGRGTGLGLAIVKHALHALAGQVDLQSTVGRGTTATCVLPEGAIVPIADGHGLLQSVG